MERVVRKKLPVGIEDFEKIRNLLRPKTDLFCRAHRLSACGKGERLHRNGKKCKVGLVQE